MIKRLILIFCTTICLQGCVNPYAKFYVDRTDGKDMTTLKTVEIPKGEPKVFRGGDVDKDNQSMRENSYALLGYSSFNSSKASNNDAISVGKSKHASVILLYSKYTHTVSGVTPLTLPDNKTTVTNSSGNAYGSGTVTGYGGSANYYGNANYSGTSTSTQYGTKTTYIPYNHARSDFMASYWIKRKPSVFGVGLGEVPNELRKSLNSNQGMLIHTVMKNTPAYKADIFKDDVLKEIGDTAIFDGKDFQGALKKYAGQKVKVTIIRNGKTIIKDINFNAFPE